MTGEPTPEVSWYKDKKKLKKSKKTQMKTEAETGVCTLEISEATTDDSGEYTVELANDVSQQHHRHDHDHHQQHHHHYHHYHHHDQQHHPEQGMGHSE